MNETVAALRASAEDALNRGFAILACEPKDKGPWVKYSQHAVNSASRDPGVALKPYDDGQEANYGIAGGQSNLTIVDCDHGLKDETELQAWMEKHFLPDTLIVRTGRTSEAGFHLFYAGAVPTVGFSIGGVTGELKSQGGYVVGPGSIHPSGEKYRIIHDRPVASLPEGLRNLANQKAKPKEFKPHSGELIAEGNRWIHLQQTAGKLKNAGISDEEVIYLALKDFAAKNCENGENYPDEKIRNLAEWAASDLCDQSDSTVVTVGSPDPEADSSIPETPSEIIAGDYVGDLSFALTNGTFIPPSFARATLKVILGAILDGKIAYPGEETIHMRHWNALISERPAAGKSEVYKRVMLFMKDLCEQSSIVFVESGLVSSGEHVVKILSANDGKNQIIYFDEMRELFDKGTAAGSTLFRKLLSLYESRSGSTGSITHTAYSFNNVGLSFTGGFTRDGYDKSVAGKGSGGDGFLSRMTLDYSKGINYEGDWEPLVTAQVNAAVTGITESIKAILNIVALVNKGMPFIPEEDHDAKMARLGFSKWLAQYRTSEDDSSGYAQRLESHFKRDILIRVAFTPERKITKALVERSIAWAKHQLMLRENLWPVDQGGAVEKFEKRILTALRKNGPLTKAGIQRYSNADKCDGGYDAWNRAWGNLLKADKIIAMQIKSDRGKIKFGFDGVWDKTKKKWLTPE